MAMVVSIVNITDAPESKKTPTRLAIYTTHLDPGEELKLPASMVDVRIRSLEDQGYIAIGQVPSWYEASKAKKLGRRRLSQKELETRLTKKSESPAPEETKFPDAPKPEGKKRIKLDDLASEAGDKGSSKK